MNIRKVGSSPNLGDEVDFLACFGSVDRKHFEGLKRFGCLRSGKNLGCLEILLEPLQTCPRRCGDSAFEKGRDPRRQELAPDDIRARPRPEVRNFPVDVGFPRLRTRRAPERLRKSPRITRAPPPPGRTVQEISLFTQRNQTGAVSVGRAAKELLRSRDPAADEFGRLRDDLQGGWIARLNDDDVRDYAALPGKDRRDGNLPVEPVQTRALGPVERNRHRDLEPHRSIPVAYAPLA